MTDNDTCVSTANPGKSDEDPEHRLYVVIHGLVCLTDVGPAGFVAHLLDIGPVHEYLYGDWLLESAIPPRATGQDPFFAYLVGVDPGVATLDPCQNAVFQLNAPPADTEEYVRAVVRLPRPDCIYYFLSGEVKPEDFSNVNEFVGRRAPERVSAIRVFQYDFSFSDTNNQDTNYVALLGRDGTPLWTPPPLAEIPIDPEGGSLDPSPQPSKVANSRTIRLAVLHIYDEPGPGALSTGAESQHNKDEFNESTEFFGVQGVTLINPAAVDGSNIPDVPGLLPGETEPLSERPIWVNALVREARGDDTEELIGGGGGTVCNGGNGIVTSHN